MKQAILIMVHKDADSVSRLISYFEGKCDIIVHIDKGGSITKEEERTLTQLPGVVGVFRKISVHWGSFSLLRCQLFLLRQSLLLSDCKYVHLISGQDYPLKPLDVFLRFFNVAECDYIEGAHLPSPGWDGNTLRRIQYYFFTDLWRMKNEEKIAKLWKFADIQEKWGIRRRIPDQVKHLYGGSAWFSLRRDCVKAVLEYTRKSPSLLRRYRFTFVPDELYIHTVVRHVDYPKKRISCNNLRFVNWAKAGDNHPASLVKEDFYKVSSSGAFFARKFDSPLSDGLRDLADKYLICEDHAIDYSSGAWNVATLSRYKFDSGLAMGLVKICRICGISDVLDLGCGPGWYVTALRKARIMAEGYDGNPHVEEISKLMEEQHDSPCHVADLTEHLEFESPYDMVVCLSVGEYIPCQFEEQVWKNITEASGKYLVVSWSTTDAQEEGIVNPHSTDDIMKVARNYGFYVDPLATHLLREQSILPTHKENLLFFTRNGARCSDL